MYRKDLSGGLVAIVYKADLNSITPFIFDGEVTEISGYSADDFISGRVHWTTIVHPDDNDAFVSHLEKFKQAGITADTEYRVVRKQGDIRWVHALCRSEWDADRDRMIISGTIYDITERKHFEARQNALMYMLPDIAWIKDLNGIHVSVNKKFLEFVGKTFEEIYGLTDEKLWGKQLAESYVRSDREVIESGKSVMVEETIVDYKGDKILTEIVKVPIKNEKNEIIGIAGTARDITERKRAEETLKKSEERFKTIFDTSRDAIFVADAETGIVLDSNSQSEVLLGLPRSEIIGLHQSALHPKEEVERYSASFKEHFRQQGAEHFEAEVQHSSGRRVPVEISASFSKLSDGKPVLIGRFLDITDRKLAQEELCESKSQLSNALHLAKLGHWEQDYSTNLFTFTDEFYAMLRTTAEEMGGYQMSSERYAELFFYPEDACLIGEEFKNAVETTDPKYNRTLEHRVKFADGTDGYVLARFFVLKDEQGRTIKTIGVNQDITERKQTEAEVAKLQEQIMQMQKLESIGRLSGGIAHDFNNLLTIILGYAELLMEDLRGAPEDTLVQLKEISAAGERAKKIVNQLLAFSRKQVLDVKVVDLNEVVRNFDKMLARLLGEDIEISLFLSEDPRLVKADRSQIEQVLLNLAVNARDAMLTGGKLTIETSLAYLDEEYASTHSGVVPGKYSLLVFSDNGTGIDEVILSQIFEPFFTTKPTGLGTGLGLSTVYGIVKQHDGHINVYSELSYGTTFKIYLPVYEGAVTQEIYSMPEPSVVGTECILVVEDDSTIRSLITRLLGGAGYSVHAAGCLSDALRVLDNIGKIDLLITDVVLPEANGLQVFRKISEIQPDVKVLYMSGYTQNVIAHHGTLDAGVKMLQKPFSAQTLLKMVQEVLYD